MLWRHPHSVRAWSAAGFLTLSILGASTFAEPAEPVPDAGARTETVGILDAQKSGDLALKVRGQGHDRVKVAIRNTSSKRLNVVLPPGLVAASVTGQLQSMGLGSPTNTANSFGSYRPGGPDAGLRSVPPAGDVREDAVAVPAGQTVEFTMAAVCLNFGKTTPTPRDTFELMDVDRYSADPRVRKALRSLATLGTSHGVAQAAMWSVCNGIPYPMMTAQFAKVVNPHEAALAARFVEALDSSGPGDLVDPAYLEEGRLFVRVGAEGSAAEDARRLAGELDGLRILGLPVRVVTGDEAPTASGPALLLNVVLGPGGRAGETKGRLSVRHATAGGGNWASLGQANFVEGSAPSVLDGPALARAIDRSVAGAFVAARPSKRSVGSTTLKIENRLPFTLGSVVVKVGDSAGAPSVPLTGLGIGPARSGLAPIQAAGGSVERVELNGL